MVRTSGEGRHVYLSAGIASAKRTNSLSWIMTSAITSERYPVTPGVPSRYGYTCATTRTALMVVTARHTAERARSIRPPFPPWLLTESARLYPRCTQDSELLTLTPSRCDPGSGTGLLPRCAWVRGLGRLPGRLRFSRLSGCGHARER